MLCLTPKINTLIYPFFFFLNWLENFKNQKLLMSFEWRDINCPLLRALLWEQCIAPGQEHLQKSAVGWVSFFDCCFWFFFSPFSVSSVSVKLLQRPQRGVVQAAAQAGAAPALLAETGAAEGQVAPKGGGPKEGRFPSPSDPLLLRLTCDHQ